MSREESRPIEQDTSSNEPSSKYRCVLRLDSGGMAEVFLAVSQGPVGFNKLFVLKRLREALAENQEHREMFLHEARLAARLNHPNVVQTYEVGEDGTGIFIAMEYLEGQPLSRIRREIAKREMAIPHEIHVRIASEVLGGLHYAHEVADYDGTPLRIVHRDVSPQNVFVTYDGQVKIVDFGIAKTHDSGTQAGIFKGKFAYTAPEQLRGEAIDRRADVFTAGIVLWEMLTGEKLLAGENPAQTLSRLLNEPIPTVSSLVPDVDPRLDAIVMRALERNPANRYQTAQAMRDALEELLVAAGLSVRQDQVARLLSDLFRNERARVQKAIKEEIATWLHSPSSSRVVAASRLPLSLSDDSVSLRRLGTNGVLRSMMTVSGRDDEPEIQVVAPSRRIDITRRRIAIALLALGACGALGYAVSSRRGVGPNVPTTPGAPNAATGGDLGAPGTATAAAAGTGVTATTGTGTATATGAATASASDVPEEAATVKIGGNAPKWIPHPKKTTSAGGASASTASPPTAATTTAPPQAPTTEATGQKEKRKFRLDL
jgi:serine/threonine protein kinase